MGRPAEQAGLFHAYRSSRIGEVDRAVVFQSGLCGYLSTS
jgi:hypothetical protein